MDELWRRAQKRKMIVILALAVFAVLSALLFMTAFSGLKVVDISVLLFKLFQGMHLSTQEKIVAYMRMPAIAMAFTAGISLSMSGAVMQSMTHNDLVSPFTLGVSAAAAFGASLCIVSGNVVMHSSIGMIAGAFLFSCLCVFLVYGISSYTGEGASALVLTGIAMNYFFSALSATVQFFAQEYKLGEIIQWTFGTLDKATWNTVGITLGVMVLASIVYYFLSLSLDAMSINDDETVRSLGIYPQRIRLIAGLVSVLLTATVISFTGVIGFIGLIAPHIARLIIGNEHRTYLPTAGLIGACLLLYSDFLGKHILYPVSIPVGIVISFVGVPIFIHLIIKMRGRG